MTGSESPWWMGKEVGQAREFARLVKEYENAGKIGAWGQWQIFIDQWSLDSIERRHLVGCFGDELDQLDQHCIEYDRETVDIW